MEGIKLYVRNSALERVAEIDEFGSLDAVIRFNGASTWVLDCPIEVAAKGLTFGGGIVVERAEDDAPLFSGPLSTSERKRDDKGDQLLVGGVDDTAWLARRLAYPVPAGPPYSTSVSDVRAGAAETVIRQYVNVNLGPGAVAARRVAGLALAADQGRGSQVTGRARFDKLLPFLQGLAVAGGDLGFKVVQAGAGLEFQVYVPQDRRESAVFSPELGNLSSYSYSLEGADANYFIAGGTGEGTARTFVERGDSESIVTFGRIEDFLDHRNTAVVDELQQEITDEIAKRAEKVGLSLAPIDTDSVAFGRDWGLGDRVSVDIDGERIEDVVREVHLKLTSQGGLEVFPTIGNPGTTDPNRRMEVMRLLAWLRERVSNLERR